jgi:mono/diheme cytochrome c family protein/ACT domain-containing protein
MQKNLSLTTRKVMGTGIALPKSKIARLGKKKSAVVTCTLLACAITGIYLPANAAEKITYDDHVRPIFADRCLNCHNPDKEKGGLDLTSYSSLLQGGSSGEIVNSGEPDSSRLFRSVTHAEEPFMPPKADKLTAQRIKVMRDWITGGLLENSGSKAKTGKPVFKVELAQPTTGKPEGPPPMPEHLVLAPAVTSSRPATPSDIASSPWAPIIALAVPRQVLLYNSSTLRLEGVLPFPEGTPSSLAFSRNGSILIAGGGRGGKAGLVVGWLVKTGQRIFEIGAEFDAVLAADITADHKLIALGGPSRRIKIFSTADGKEVANIKKHTDWVTSIAFSPDGILLATGDRNGGLFVWESVTANPFYTLKGHSKSITAISWQADSNLIASASEDGSVRLWEMSEGKQVKNWTAHSSGITDMAYTADGRIATCGRDRQAKVWDGNGSEKSVAKDFSDIPVTACLSHDGSRLIAADWVGNVRVFNSSDGKLIGSLLANPPALGTRIAQAQTVVKTQQKKLEGAIGKHSGQLTEATAAAENLATISSRIAASKKQMETSNRTLDAARLMLSKSREDHAAIVKQTEVSKQKIGKIEVTLNADPAVNDNREQLEAELKMIRSMLDQLLKDIASREATSLKIESTIKISQETLATATAAFAAVSGKLKPAQENHALKVKDASGSKAVVDSLQGELAIAMANQQHWQAANINIDRHKKMAARPTLEAELEQLELSRKKSEQSHQLSVNAANVAEKSATDIQKAEAASLTSLNAAKGRLPVLEWELRLNELIATQQRQAMTGIREAMKEAPGTMKPKIQAAIDEAGKAVASADVQTGRVKDLIQHSVTNAQNALDEIRSSVAGTQKALAARQTEQAAALVQVQEAKKAYAAGTKKIGQLDAEIAELQERYTQALPSATGKPLK